MPGIKFPDIRRAVMSAVLTTDLGIRAFHYPEEGKVRIIVTDHRWHTRSSTDPRLLPQVLQLFPEV